MLLSQVYRTVEKECRHVEKLILWCYPGIIPNITCGIKFNYLYQYNLNEWKVKV